MRHSETLANRRVGLYVRYSSDLQSDTSLEDQIRLCNDFVVGKDGSVQASMIFRDAAVSGASLDRPGFRALMQAVRSRRIDVIVTENLDRISRDLADAATVFRELRYLDVQLVAVSNGFDSNSDSAQVMLMLESWKNETYLKDLRFKTRRSLAGRAHNGFSTGGLPLGYTSVEERSSDGELIGKRIVIDDEGAATIRRISSSKTTRTRARSTRRRSATRAIT